jgi:cytochrome P450
MTSETGQAPRQPRLFGPEMLEDPYPFYHRLRAASPVFWAEGLDAWLATRYDDAAAALRNSQLSSDRSVRLRQRMAGKGLDDLLTRSSRSMIHLDPPDHTRQRTLVNKAFTPRAVDAMAPHIQALVDGCLDAVQGRGAMDVIADLAYPLPVTVIAEMLGVPPEDRARFKKWSDEISFFLSGNAAEAPPEELRRSLHSRGELVDYFRAVVARRRAQPQADLLTALAQAEEAGGRLSEDEVYDNAVLLLIAGNETTTNLIGNGLLALLRHPDQLRKLQADPSLIPNAVEELLRYDGPVQFTTRVAKTDLTLGGQAVRAGQMVFLMLGAANRDPAQFPEPDRLDVTRKDVKHIAFGAGPHFCLGAPLARLEGQIAFRTLLRRLPGLRLAEGPIEHRNNINLRGLQALPVRF